MYALMRRQLRFGFSVMLVLVAATMLGCWPEDGGNGTDGGGTDGGGTDGGGTDGGGTDGGGTDGGGTDGGATDGGGTDGGGTDGGGTDGGGTDGGGTDGGGQVGAIVADHLAATAFDLIPAAFIDSVKSNYRIFYGHTSHGSQIVAGMTMIYRADSRYAFNAGAGTLSLQEETGVDLGHEGDTSWAATTRGVLNQPGCDVNMVMWSWCGGVSDNTEQGINTYLQTMNQLESEYPNVLFVYMTGHLDGTGPSGNLYVRNNQIRTYCQTNNKILFDFADIESYDPDGTYYPNGSDWCEWCETWCATHSCPDLDCVDDDDCQHSVCFNCYQKGRAFWWMMARIAGWTGS